MPAGNEKIVGNSVEYRESHNARNAEACTRNKICYEDERAKARSVSED